MTETAKRALVLCTGNSCRSIIAEALFNHLTAGRWRADSAGSQPTGQVHPGALAVLESHGVNPGQPASESWDRYAETTYDLVVTVCDNAAGETCPAFPGAPARLHWSIPDPATAPDDQREAAFEQAFHRLRQHITEDLPA